MTSSTTTTRAPRIKRDCAHPIANHVHGTRAAYVLDRCRCELCTDASAEAQRTRKRQQLYGTWDPFVDAGPVREHVRALMTAGCGLKTVARRSGVSTATIGKLLYGVPTKGQAPRRRLRRETADKLRAVRADRLADHTPIDSTGTRRRLEALVAAGWSMSALGRHLDINGTNMPTLMQRSKVLSITAERVRDLFDRLADTKPPNETWHEKASVTRARRLAVRRQWAPAAAWFELDIDDPATEPDFTAVRVEERKTRNRAEDAEDVEWLLRTGVAPDQVYVRLGYRNDKLLRDNLHQIGRTDLAAIIAGRAPVIGLVDTGDEDDEDQAEEDATSATA